MKSIVFAGGLALLGTLLGTRLANPRPGQEGLRAADPRRRPNLTTTSSAERPPWVAWSSSAAVLIAYFGSDLITCAPPSASALLVLFLFTGLGVVGFLDDYIKISKQRSLGLRSKAKIAGQIDHRHCVRGRVAAVPRRAGDYPGVTCHLVPARHRMAAAAD